MFAEIRKEVLQGENKTPLPMVICTIGVKEEQEPISRPNGIPHHHLIWVTKGTGIFRVGEERFLLEKGEGLFCRKYVPHGYESTGEMFQTEWITFLGAEGLLDYCGVGEYLKFKIPKSAAESAAVLRTVCEGNSTVLSRSAAGYTWLTEFLSELLEPYNRPEQTVQQYMEVHYREYITLEDIAAQVNMSKYALCHYYARTQGITVMEQLKRIRIDKAKQLLRFTFYPIAEIGRMCGYESSSYFGKQFRELTGYTPREYRENIKAQSC